MPLDAEEIGKIIRFHRQQAALTQIELAHLARIGKTAVFDLEHGKRTVRLETLLRVLDALNIRLDWTGPLKAAYSAHKGQEPT